MTDFPTSTDHIRAHDHSYRNRDEIDRSEICGCFFCISIFSPLSITEWVHEDDGIGQTALCPYCEVDSVIGSHSGFSITHPFLSLMYLSWFN
jgi:hypothetical protein